MVQIKVKKVVSEGMAKELKSKLGEERFAILKRIWDAYNYLVDEGKVNSVTDLAEKINRNYTSVTTIINGSRSVTPRIIADMNKYFDYPFNHEWIITGKGDMLANKSAEAIQKASVAINQATATNSPNAIVNAAYNGNITVTDKGDFIREFTINGKKIKKGMYSPLRQVEAQREVIRKIWESNTSNFKKFFASKNFEYYRRVLVVAANQDTILNTNYAPKDIKYNILRADALVRQIEYDFNHRGNDEVLDSRKSMEEIAKSYLDCSSKDIINYYEFYKSKYCSNIIGNDELRDRLIEFRKQRSNEMGVPAYYVFTNDELDKLIEVRPQSIEVLKKSNILTPIKIKTHGELIINEINR